MATAVRQGHARPAPQQQQQPEPDNAALLDEAILNTVDRLDTTARRYTEELAKPELGHLRKAILMGQAIAKLDAAIDDNILKLFMGLMNDPLGFGTDRAKPGDQPYDKHTVKRCIICGLMQGVYPFNNEWNIIGGKFMIVQNGWRRKLRELPGLTDLDIPTSETAIEKGQWVTRFAARWKYNGARMDMRDALGQPGRKFFTPCDNRTRTADAAAGKNLRKCLKAIYEMTTGSAISEADDDEIVDPTTGEVKPRSGGATSKVHDQLHSKAQQIAGQTAQQITDTLINAINIEAERVGMMPGDFHQLLRDRGIQDIANASEEQGKALLEAICKQSERGDAAE